MCTAPLDQKFGRQKGLDVGFSSCTAPTYYHSLGISNTDEVQIAEVFGKSSENNIAQLELSVEVKREARKLGGVRKSGGVRKFGVQSSELMTR